MVSIMEIMQLCRLCLVKEQVNIPIFEEQDDVRQICLKITSCLPVKITKEDKLPKKICDGCLYKLELLYQFYNTTANAEKQLLTWIEQINMDANEKNLENLAAQSTPPTVKQEKLEPVESTNENPDMSAEAQNYMLDQETFQPDFTFKESQGSTADAVDAAENSDEPLAKRPRRGRPRQATKPIPPESLDSSDNDNDNDDAGDSMLEMTVTKTEEESESEGEENVDDPEPTKFEAVGEDTEQPGPSGLGKGGADGPSHMEKRCSNVDECPYCLKVHFWGIQKRCEICSKYFAGEEALAQHKKRSHPGKDGHKCDTCGKSFKTWKYLGEHIKGVHERDPERTCVVCGKCFTTKTSLATHMMGHTRQYRFKCEKCDKGYITMDEFERHLISHDVDPYQKCEHCGKRFRNQQYFKKHVASHDPNHVRDEYPCELCSKVFLTKKSLVRHTKSHEGISAPTYMCETCGKTVTTVSSLVVHQRIHTGERPFVCDTCGKGFISAIVLKQHLVVHTKQKPHECRICGKCFSQKSTLRIHLRYHTGERPYKCDICAKKFVSRSLLNVHSKTHGSTLK